MKKIMYLCFLHMICISCKKEEKHIESEYFSSVVVDTLIQGDFSIRAIVIDNDKVWYAADKGIYGNYAFSTKEKWQQLIAGDTVNPEFRSIAQNNKSIFVLSVGSPALLYKIAKDGSERKLVYKESHKNAFYDAMHFWNEKEGIAMGDPTDGCLSVMITRDSGETWTKIPCAKLPQTVSGEAAFAASNTSLILKGNATWMVSGGKKARVFYSPDKGRSWEVSQTPLVQGEEMAGIFSADFYDENIGFITGGDYQKPQQNSGNKALTINGGKTWTLIAENSGFGYASCVQFVPNSAGKQLVTLGYSGLNYSSDNGATWKQLLKDKDLHTIKFIDNSTAIAAGKNKIVKITFKQ